MCDFGGRTTCRRPWAASPAATISTTLGIGGMRRRTSARDRKRNETFAIRSARPLPLRGLRQLDHLVRLEPVDLVDQRIGIGGVQVEASRDQPFGEREVGERLPLRLDVLPPFGAGF